MMLLGMLILAHLIGDFVLQPDSWVADKQKLKIKSPKLYMHIAIHLLLMLVMTKGFTYFPAILFIAVTHYIIDLGKLYLQNPKNARILFTADQILHIVVILLTVNHIDPFLEKSLQTVESEAILALCIAIVFITSVTSKIIKVWISKWAPETEDKDEDSLSKAGTYIGILERLFVFGFVITNNIQAVGFLLAAKSVFRFGDLKESKDRKLTEYILIGTLISFGIAILTALLFAYTQDIKIGL